MSANIPIGKLSFTVFGYGYNSDRADSGSGMKESIPLNFSADYAEFDATGQYCWIMKNSGGLTKYETKDWTIVDQGEVSHGLNWINKPKNVLNGYAIAKDNNSSCIFDLTTNEIIATGSALDMWGSRYDCIETESGLYRFVPQSSNRGTINIFTLDPSNMSLSKSPDRGNRAGVGFIDDDSAYVYYPPEWFYQAAYVESYNVSGGYDWGQQASDDDKMFSNVSMHGLVKDSYIYVPTNVNGTWKLAEYDGLSQVNFITPNYIRAFGNLGNEKVNIYAEYAYPVYSSERNTAAFVVDGKGLYITDFSDVYSIIDFDTATYRPLAVSDSMVICIKQPKPSGALSLEVFEF